MMRIGIAVLVGLLAVGALEATQPPAGGEGVPVLAERDVLLLTVFQQQIEIAQLRLQRAVADLKRPGWRVDLIDGQWRYVPVPPEGP